MIDLLWNLLRSLPLLSALLLIAAVRTKRERRVEQLGTAIFAVVYFVAALIVLYRFNSWIADALGAISHVVPLGNLRPNSISLYLYENLFVLGLFAALKLGLLPILRAAFSRWRDAIEGVVQGLYSYSADDSAWFISARFANLRKYLKTMYWASIAITLVFTTLLLTYPGWPGFAAVAFPALAALVVGELFFALDGLTKQEFSRDIEGERDSATRIANYNPLRKVMREVFGDRVLADEVHLTSRAALGSGYRVGELALSDDERERLAGAYFQRLRHSQVDVDVNLVEASLDLLEGRSVLVNNPFYLDLTPYICLPAYYALLQSKQVLVIAGRDSLVEDLRTWIGTGLEDITGIPDLWNVDVLTTHAQTGLHVGLLPFADVHNLELMKSNAEFLAGVQLVILAEPSRMLATGQLGLSLIISRCGDQRRPTFAAFDGNHDGLVDALSHLLKTSFTEVVASALPQGSSAEVVWQSEGDHMHVEVLPRISRYMGMGTEIGAVALKYQVPRFHWVGGDSFPVVDMQWIAEQYFAQINSFSDLDLSQDALRDAFVAVPNPWAVKQDENYFLIVEDESCNAYEAIRRYATRATVSGFINLISDEYLLRDYMVDNHELFSADPKAIPSVVPDFARSERNLALRMIMQMTWGDLSEEQLCHEFELVGLGLPEDSSEEKNGVASDREPAVIRLLRTLIVENTNVSDLSIRQLTGFELRDRIGDGNEKFYRIQETPGLEKVRRSLQPAYFFVEDERGGVNRIGSLLFDHVYQAVLPGQFLTHSGKYYEVQSIGSDEQRSGVVLRRAADHIRDRRSYRQWRSFHLSDLTNQDSIGAVTDRGGVVTRRLVATITVDSFGYFEMASRSDLESARPVRVEGIPKREYSNKAVLEVRLPEVPDEVRKTIALLLNELFVTVFPNSSPYVIALTRDDEGSFGQLLSAFSGDVDDQCIYVVEDSMIDLGLIVAVDRNWDRFMEIIADYLDWYTSPPAPPVKVEEKRSEFVLEFPEIPEPKKNRNWISRIVGKIRKGVRGSKGDDKSAVPIGSAEELKKPGVESVDQASVPVGEAESDVSALDIEAASATDAQPEAEEDGSASAPVDGSVASQAWTPEPGDSPPEVVDQDSTVNDGSEGGRDA